jgi:hypothetical protein
MYDVPPSDLTAFAVLPYEERRGREETPIGEWHGRPTPSSETYFVSFEQSVPRLQGAGGAGTLTMAELRLARPMVARSDETAEKRSAEDEIARTRDHRIALLARRFEGTETVEDGARLRVLTERMRKLAPRVTSGDIERVVGIVADAEEIHSTLAGLKSKYGLR